MKSKQQLIEEFLKTPIAVGENIYIYQTDGIGENRTDLSTINKEKADYATVTSVNEDGTYGFTSDWKKGKFSKDFIKERTTSHIGGNPFIEEPWDSSIRFLNIDIESLLGRAGSESTSKITIDGVDVPRLEWNPIIIDADGNEKEYQRGFVWSLHDKQNLLESIYHHIEIGKFIFRERSYEYVEKRIKAGKVERTAFTDIVDGKQRLDAILGFVNDQYADASGYLFSELSGRAQSKFKNFQKFAFGQLEENTSDQSVIRAFLGVNFAGVPMSAEHIEYVRNLNL